MNSDEPLASGPDSADPSSTRQENADDNTSDGTTNQAGTPDLDNPGTEGDQASDAVDQTASASTAETPPDANAKPNEQPPTASAETAAGAENQDAPQPERPQRRVRLNPTVDESQTRAIPSRPEPPRVKQPAPSTESAPPTESTTKDTNVSSEASKTDSEPVAEQTVAAQENEQQDSAPEAPTAAAPAVEIPKDVEGLDAALEAEIEAAMSEVKDSAITDAAGGTPESSAKADSEELTEETIEQGHRLKGTVQSIHGDNVFVDIGFRSPGVVALRQFESEKPPEVGQSLDLTVDRYDANEGLVFVNLPRGRQHVGGNWDAVSVGQIVDCVVNKTNKGGLEVNVGTLRGFLPAGQVDLQYVGDLEPFVGQKLRVKITEANRQRRNLIVSRRAVLEEDRREAEEALWLTLEVGQKFAGRIKTIKNYGAFVDLGGVDGFLHIGQISWNRIKHPSEVISVGQEVEVQVVSLEKDQRKIGLGMRQLQANPWDNVENEYPIGTTISGKVSRILDFGAFVELQPGVEGLVHISELDYKRVNRVADVLSVGQEIDVKVLEVDPNRKRVSLSLKALKPAPKSAEPEQQEEEPESPPPVRKRKEPLKGGIGSGSGQLFGDPKDYS